MAHLRMEFLGGFRVSLDGTPITTFESSKVRALLAYLAIEAQRPHPRESLAALLWPDWPNRAALSNLRYALSNLRKVIGDRTADPPFLLISREAIQFNLESDHWLDVAEFTRLAGSQDVGDLEKAICLYKGEFLEGFSVSEAIPFEDWARLKCEQLHRACREMLHYLAEMLENRREYDRALTYARRQVESEAWDESAQRQLMRLLAQSGRRGEALNQFERLKVLLGEELGVVPEVETIHLHQQIKTGETLVPDGGKQYEIVSDVYQPADSAPSKPFDAHRHNLPASLTSFVGRGREIGEIKQLIASTRLLTLTGIGGTGKTRLALKVSADMISEFSGGVWLVELATLRDPALVEHVIASVLGVCDRPDQLMSDLLIEHVRERNLLIILDNCEHLVDACARLAYLLLSAAPNLKILATSRVPLYIPGEVNYSVPPLSLPDSHKIAQLLDLAEFDAIRLFIERAASVQPAFSLTDENAPAVTLICQHLDGIPLAIELATARMRLLSPDQIAARLDDRFTLLTGGSRSALPRQQTIRATMDWSYDLLDVAERTLFNRLAVFTGSFSLEAVEAVCVDKIGDGTPAHGIQPSQMLDLLGALVDHSLVYTQERTTEARYGLLETVHQYALENLVASGELHNLQERHLAYYLEFAERGLPHVSAGQPIWTHRFEAEYDNLRSAMEYAIENSLESAIRFEDPLLWFAQITHRDRECYDWLMRIFELTKSWPPGKLRAIALKTAGEFTVYFGDISQGLAYLAASLQMARDLQDKSLINLVLHDLQVVNNHLGNWELWHDYAEEHLEISRELGDKAEISCALFNLGDAAIRNGDSQAGRKFYEQSLDIARQENHLNMIAFNLYSLATLAQKEGDTSRAKELYRECAQIRRDWGFRTGLALTLLRLAQVLIQEGNAIQSKKLAEESLEICRELNITDMKVYCLNIFAGAVGIDRQDERAARLFGAAQAATEKLDVETEYFYHMTYDPIIAVIREQLGETDFNKAWAEGRNMTLEQAVELALN
jgi:predicted ATPase/DNA-binding SARP family transcriptional activator